MKKIFALVVALLICVPFVKAQTSFGVKAGMYFNTMSDIKPIESTEIINVKARTGFHVGAMCKYNLPYGFAVQPELLYINKTSTLKTKVLDISEDTKLHYIQMPIGFQWGVDLVMFRPFIQFTPYIGYAIAKGGLYDDVEWDDFNRFEYGVGLGAGVEIWKIQLSGRYSWDLGKVSNFKWNAWDINDTKNRGFELSIGFLF